MNGGFEGVIRSSGRFAIFCCAVGAWRLLQLKHSLRMPRTVDLALIIQNLCLISDRVYSRPECPEMWWQYLIMSLTTWCFFGRITGCFASVSIGARCRQPPTRMRPWVSIGSSLKMLLDFFTTFCLLELSCWFTSLSRSHSFLKHWLWTCLRISISAFFTSVTVKGTIALVGWI